MYVQSRPRWLWDLASPGEARRSVPRGPSAVGLPPIGEIATSRAREVFSTDRVAEQHATIRVFFSALFPNNSKSALRVHPRRSTLEFASRRQGFKIAITWSSKWSGYVWKSDRLLVGVYVYTVRLQVWIYWMSSSSFRSWDNSLDNSNHEMWRRRGNRQERKLNKYNRYLSRCVCANVNKEILFRSTRNYCASYGNHEIIRLSEMIQDLITRNAILQ